MIQKILVGFVALGVTQSAWAILPRSNAVNDYQIGSEWGKAKVTQDVLDRATEVFKRTALATARYGATSFYLGKFSGKHIMATNHHVIRSTACRSSAQFTHLKKSYPCKEIFVDLPEIDLALFEIHVPAADEALLKSVAKNFSFDAQIVPGQELLTIGYGIAGNPLGNQMGGQDSDCTVFSGKNEFRFMGDPDRFNPADYKAWSFSTGCDVSHGDSGSAFVDRKTGAILGIVWTGAIPKRKEIQDSAELKKIFDSQAESIWEDLSYVVPAAKIKEVLLRVASEQTTTPAQKAVIENVVYHRSE